MNTRPAGGRRTVVEATAWRFRTGSAWRDLPERFGNWNTIYKNFRRWATEGVWEDLLTHVQRRPRSRARSTGSCRWIHRSRVCISTVRPCPGAQGLHRTTRDPPEPCDHAIGRSRGGLTTKIHLVCDGRARPLAFVLTGGQVADTSVFTCVLDEIRVPGRGQARTRPHRVLADKGYPSKKNRAWLRERGIKATIPERADQIEKRQKRPADRSTSATSSGNATKGATSSNDASTQ